MGRLDLFLVAGGSILVATVVSGLQRSAVQGPLTLMDLLAPAPRDPREQVLFFVVSLGVPLAVGALVSICAVEKTYVAALATGLGAFFAVDNAFFRPDTLAPPLQEQVSSVRRVYARFVLTYTLLGYLGPSVLGLIRTHYDTGQLVNSLVSQGILCFVAFLFGSATRRRANEIIELAEKQDEKYKTEIKRRLSDFLDMPIKGEDSKQRGAIYSER